MDPRARGRLIEAHLPLVRSLARRFVAAGEPLDDLVQVGSIGLIKAVDGFDPGRGSTLGSYAAPSIVGEIRHHLRDRATLVRLPRRLHESGARIRFEPLDGHCEALVEPVDPLAAAEVRIGLERAIARLDTRERRLLALCLFRDVTQAEVAAAVGLSPAQVSRLMHRTYAKLREELDGAPNGQVGLAPEREAA